MKKEFQEAKAKYEAEATEYEDEKNVMEALIKRRDTLATDLPNLEEAVNKAEEENNNVIRRRALGKASEKEHAEAFEALNDASFNFDRALVEHATIVSEVDKAQKEIDKSRHSLRHAREAFWCAVRDDAIASAVKAAGPHLIKIHSLTLPAGELKTARGAYMDGVVKDVFQSFSRSNDKVNDSIRQKLAKEYGLPT